MTLYKYVTPDRIDILEGLLVRFTQPSALNDLSELRPAFGALLTREDTEEHLRKNPINPAEMARRAYEELPPEIRSKISPTEMEQLTKNELASDEGKSAIDVFAGLALEMMNSFAPRIRAQMYETLDRLVGVFSLSESWNNGPMWAHYAANHAGFVIGLDETHGFFDRRRTEHDEFYHLRKVFYADNLGTPRAFRDIAEGASVLLTKDIRWSYEQEQRMLAPLSDATITVGSPTDPIHLFQLPPDTIRCIIFGVRASEDLIRKVRQTIDRPGSQLGHVILLRCAVDDERGGLRLTPALP